LRAISLFYISVRSAGVFILSPEKTAICALQTEPAINNAPAGTGAFNSSKFLVRAGHPSWFIKAITATLAALQAFFRNSQITALYNPFTVVAITVFHQSGFCNIAVAYHLLTSCRMSLSI
jgi:hypothetical protein